jgi:hypothetical protein
VRPVTPDPKPTARIIDPDAGRAKVWGERRCRVCCQPYDLTRHHLVPVSLGGDDVDDNIVPLCGDGTRGCHGLVEDFRADYRHALRLTMAAEEVAYVVAKKGEAWLDRYYPRQPPRG